MHIRFFMPPEISIGSSSAELGRTPNQEDPEPLIKSLFDVNRVVTGSELSPNFLSALNKALVNV